MNFDVNFYVRGVSMKFSTENMENMYEVMYK